VSFKVHLIIISCIVIVVLLVWQFMPHSAAPVPDNAAMKQTYSIAITHASWGLNCKNTAVNSDNSREAFLNKSGANNKLHADNVLSQVSHLCNGATSCNVKGDETTFGSDPAPDCNDKMLEIEYRCFSYDRPWNVKSATTVNISCEQPAK